MRVYILFQKEGYGNPITTCDEYMDALLSNDTAIELMTCSHDALVKAHLYCVDIDVAYLRYHGPRLKYPS
jgi:hypothetical protein